jgi:Raf kinase inhibitor-like YbhB/YbcL family protein
MRLAPHAPHAMIGALLAVPFVALGALGGGCQHRTDPDTERVALDLPQTDGPMILHVRSDAFDEGQEIPEENSAYGRNISPRMGWSGLPEGTRSIVLMMEDPDAPRPKPFVHWLVYNIPRSANGLPPDLGTAPVPAAPEAGVQGRNSTGQIGYFGPKPPKGDPAHHYHFQVFALDQFLALKPGATRQDLLREMNGRVLGKGRLIGTYHER